MKQSCSPSRERCRRDVESCFEGLADTEDSCGHILCEPTELALVEHFVFLVFSWDFLGEVLEFM